MSKAYASSHHIRGDACGVSEWVEDVVCTAWLSDKRIRVLRIRLVSLIYFRDVRHAVFFGFVNKLSATFGFGRMYGVQFWPSFGFGRNLSGRIRSTSTLL